MKVRYTIHQKAAMVGKVEDVDDARGERLISAGHAVRALSAEPATAAGGRAAGRRAAATGARVAGDQAAGDSTSSGAAE